MMDKNRKTLLMDILQGAAVIFLVGWLCYRNLIASLAGMVVLPVFIRFKEKKRVNQRQTRLWKEFKDVTAMMYSSTAAGGTLEKALRDVRKDMLVSAGRYQVLLPEFEKICIQLDRNISVETVLNDFADRCNDKDILYFVKILNIARKSGGALPDIIRHTSDTMNLRMEINSEIDTLLAGKKGEWKVMLIVPPAILIYMNLCSADYMAVLYTTLTGRILMTAALALYGIAMLIGYKILDIQV